MRIVLSTKHLCPNTSWPPARQVRSHLIIFLFYLGSSTAICLCYFAHTAQVSYTTKCSEWFRFCLCLNMSACLFISGSVSLRVCLGVCAWRLTGLVVLVVWQVLMPRHWSTDWLNWRRIESTESSSTCFLGATSTSSIGWNIGSKEVCVSKLSLLTEILDPKRSLC